MAKAGSVRDLVDSFTADIEALIREEIRRGFEAAIGGAPSRAPARTVSRASAAPAAKPAAGGRRKKGEKRSPAELVAVKESLCSYIAKNAGQGIEAIGKALGVPTKDLARPAKQLIEAKAIRTTGAKR